MLHNHTRKTLQMSHWCLLRGFTSTVKNNATFFYTMVLALLGLTHFLWLHKRRDEKRCLLCNCLTLGRGMQKITAKLCWVKTISTPVFACLLVFKANIYFLLQSVPKLWKRKKCSKIFKQQGWLAQCHNFRHRFPDTTEKVKKNKNLKALLGK